MSKTHKTDTEVKTGVRLRMSVRDNKSQETESAPAKPRKSNGPKGNPADRRNRKRASVAATKEEIERKRRSIALEWSLVNAASLTNVVLFFVTANEASAAVSAVICILALLLFYNRRVFKHWDDLADKKEIR